MEIPGIEPGNPTCKVSVLPN